MDVKLLRQAAFVATLRTADALEADVAGLLKPDRLSPPLYNVLRIVAGAGAEGLRCGEIGERLISREPDVTRLVDRLARRRLVGRRRDRSDGRVVRVVMTSTGQALLDRLAGPMLALHDAQFGALPRADLERIVALLERVRRR